MPEWRGIGSPALRRVLEGFGRGRYPTDLPVGPVEEGGGRPGFPANSVFRSIERLL